MTGSRRGSALAAVLAVGGVLLVCLLAVYAATVGPRDVLGARPETNRSHSVPTEPTSSPPSQAPQEEQDLAKDSEKLSTWWVVLPLLLYIVAAALFALAAYAILRWLLGRFRDRDLPVDEGPEADLSDLDVVALRRSLVESADEQRLLLVEGEPRNAVVRAWQVFEEEAAALHHARQDWQTSTEFTLAVVRATGVDAGALDDLAEVFRRARFSRSPVTEADRATALAALDRVHGSLVRS